MRLLGLDYGRRYVGVALSDGLGVISYPLEVISRKDETKLRKTYARIEVISKEYNIDRIIVGLPLNMDGSESDMSAAARVFAEAVERRTGVETVLFDERLTSIEAADLIKEGGVSCKDRKKYIDKVAAALILKSYMEEKGMN